jgi:phospholipid/cholesterol/gamma-HCH transport system substrate-binding protein
VKVGVFVLLGLAVLAYMTFRLGELRWGEPPGYRVYAVFEQATGLKKGAPVEMAGIQIGGVQEIGLDGGRARVTMRISPEVELAQDVAASIRTRGVLGDKYVALEPGSPAAPRLAEGERITQAQVPPGLDEMMNKVGHIADDVQDLTQALKVSLASPESQQNLRQSLANMRELTGALKDLVAQNQRRLDGLVDNLAVFARDMRQLSGANKEALTQTIQNFQQVSRELEGTIASLGSVARKIDRGEGALGALVNERRTVDDLNQTLASLKEVARKIDQGKGTIGKLVNDDTTVTKIDEALTGINDFLGRADSWRAYVDYRGEYLFGEDSLRSTLNLRLQPRPDKFYLLGVQSDPVGRRTVTDTTRTVYQGGTSWQRRERVEKVDKDELKFNAQIGKRFYDLTARAGIFASTGGVGLDYHLWDDRLTFTLEAYDFRQDDNPHLRFAMDYSFWRYFYLSAGADDFISDDDRSTFFLGAGISFYDDDIKWLLTNAPSP